jgi:hypothetical protein
LMVLGTLLTLGGLLWGAGELRREYRDLAWRFRGISIIRASQMPRDEQELHSDDIAQVVDLGRVEFMREWIRFHVLEQAADNLGWPLGLTLLGVVCSTAAGVWSHWAWRQRRQGAMESGGGISTR